MSSPFERYLLDLERALPVPSPRTVEEIRGHLHDAKERAMESGLDADAAELEAVTQLGSVESVVASVRSDGTPHLSPALIKAAPLIAALFALPALVFITVNLVEVAAGNEGGVGVFGDSFAQWEREVNMLLTLGPVAAFLVLFLTHSDIRVARVTRGFELSMHLRLKGLTLFLALLTGLLIVGILAYLLSENLFCTLESFPIC